MNTAEKRAVYRDVGKLELESGALVHWDRLDIPFGSTVMVVVHYERGDYMSGLNGIVWATHSREQAETIQGALLAQGIGSDLRDEQLDGTMLFRLQVADRARLEAAIDFIWRSEEGLQLRPDWHYPTGTANESLARWTRAL